MSIMSAVVRILDVVKNYQLEGGVVHALRGVSLRVEEGDFVALMGPSGSGKSTLLNVLGCLDRPTSGEYHLGEEEVAVMDDDQLSEIRSLYLGFIFQSYNLLPQYTVVENIEVPLLYQGRRLGPETRDRCIALAEMVGLGDRLEHRPTQLSGGQQQRVAIARALVNDPHVILADEPTGNLDSQTSDEIMRLLRKLNDAGKTIIMVTHETDIAAWARRAVRMRDGHIESDVRNDHARSLSPAALTVALPNHIPLPAAPVEPRIPVELLEQADPGPVVGAVALDLPVPPPAAPVPEASGAKEVEAPAALVSGVPGPLENPGSAAGSA